MAKIIAFYGSPGSGKTTLALKAAMRFYLQTREKEISVFLSPDINVPSVALLLPNHDPDEIFTIGSIIERPDITKETLLKNMITAKNSPNLGILGYKSGDNRFSYPQAGNDKINEFFDVLNSIADYIFVDCSNDYTDKISRRALETADVIFRVISADPKGMAWLSTEKIPIQNENNFAYNVVCNVNNDSVPAIDDICNCFTPVLSVIPYSKIIHRQMMEGRLLETAHDNAFTKKLDILINRI